MMSSDRLASSRKVVTSYVTGHRSTSFESWVTHKLTPDFELDDGGGHDGGFSGEGSTVGWDGRGYSIYR